MQKEKKLSKKQRRLIFIGTITLISMLSLAFALNSFRENIVFFYSPSELNKVDNLSKKIRVGGMIKEGSVIKFDALNTEFTITDYEQDLKISYHGILPDLFRDGQGVVAKGFLSEDRTKFFASELLVKHDENYMPPEVAKSLKERMENGTAKSAE